MCFMNTKSHPQFNGPRMQTARTTPRTPGRVERYDTIVIGGGQAGLAVGHGLAMRDVDFAILDGGAEVGDSWRQRWDSLRLFTPAAYSGLPGMVFPAPPMHLPDKDQTADYLACYAERFDLPVRLRTRVLSLRWNGERYVANAGTVQCEADNVVVATGPFHRPRVPAVASRLSPDILQLHSNEYRNPFELPDGPVLVVGAGNSGAQIAMELAHDRKVWLAGRDTGHLPRRFLGRDLFDWIWPMLTRATLDTRAGRRIRARASRGGDALIGIPESSIAATGITRIGRIDGERGGMPMSGDRVIQPRVIVWCTGFTPDYQWIDLPATDASGNPRHVRGVAADHAGLYFAGLRFQHRMTSSLLGGVGADAEYVAERIARVRALAAAA